MDKRRKPRKKVYKCFTEPIKTGLAKRSPKYSIAKGFFYETKAKDDE